MIGKKRITLSKQFVQESWALICENKSLYWLPLLNLLVSSILVLGVVFDVVWPLVYAGEAHTETVSVLQIIIGVILLLLIPLISNVFNATIIFFCHAKINEEETSLSKAFSKSLKFWPQLLVWSFLQTLVGTILNIIDNGHPTVANFVIDAFLGAAWALLSFFVMPVMLLENKNAFSAIKESTGIVREIWGKRAIISLGLVSLLFFVLLVLGAGGIFLSFNVADEFTPVLLGISIIYLIAVLYTRRLMMTVVRLKLYLAVKTGAYSH